MTAQQHLRWMGHVEEKPGRRLFLKVALSGCDGNESQAHFVAGDDEKNEGKVHSLKANFT